MSRKQLNMRTDDAFDKDVDDIRRLSHPIPSVAEAVRMAVRAYAAQLREGAISSKDAA